MNINAPVVVSDLKFNKKCQILLFKPAINYPVVVAKLNPSQKSSQLQPSCSRDRDGMLLITRINSKHPRVNRRTKGSPPTPVRPNPKLIKRPVQPALMVGPVQQQPQHPHRLPLPMGLRDQVRLRGREHLPVPMPPVDLGLLPHPALSPNSHTGALAGGTCPTVLKTVEVLFSR